MGAGSKSTMSAELKCVRVCTLQLETALMGCEREVVHFLKSEGYITSEVLHRILTPALALTEIQKSGELVKSIKNKVKQDPDSFHKLVKYLKQHGQYAPIVRELEKSFVPKTSSLPLADKGEKNFYPYEQVVSFRRPLAEITDESDVVQIIIVKAMGNKDVTRQDIPVESEFTTPENTEHSRRFYGVRGFAWFSCPEGHNHWASAHARGVIDLKMQRICYRYSQLCKTCGSKAYPEFAMESLERMAKYAVRRYLNPHNGEIPSHEPDVTLCHKCIMLGRRCTESTESTPWGDKLRRNRRRIDYEMIIKKKKTLRIRSVRFVNIGIPRSGKTTFWLRLVKRIVDMQENLPSTGVVEEQQPVLVTSVDAVKMDNAVIATDEWSELGEGGYANVLLDMFSKVLRDSSAAAETLAENQISGSETQHLHDISTPTKEAIANAESAPVADLSTFTSLFNKASEFKWETLKCALEDITLLSTADTGGHAEFLDMHAALINGPTFNLIFCRLTDNFSGLFKVYYTDENGTNTEEVDSDLTVKEVMFQVLSNATCSRCTDEELPDADITSLQKALKSRESKAMFVGTFADKLNDEEFCLKDAELKLKLKDELGEKFHKAVMYADHDKKQLMLKVNNKDGGEAEIDEIRAILKEKIEKCFDRIPIPASWFVLGLLIRDHTRPTMTLKHCEELAKKLTISPEELQTALWFLHHCLGFLLYYPESNLKDTVFCKIQAIYQSITDLIKKTYTARYVPNESSLNEFDNLGLFSLKEIGSNAPDCPIPRDLLVQLLEHLNIITPAPTALSPSGISDPYFMPCKLRCSREPLDAPAKGNPEPLKLHFKCGFTPMGVFPALITKLFSQMKELDWAIVTEDERFFKNRVKFRVGRDIIFLASNLHYFEIVISLRSPKDTRHTDTETLCHNVRTAVANALEEVTNKMNYDFLGGHEYAFWCTKCPCHAKKHLAIFEQATASAFMVCRQDKAETVEFTTCQTVWFAKALSKGCRNSSPIHEQRAPIHEQRVEAAYGGPDVSPVVSPVEKLLCQKLDHGQTFNMKNILAALKHMVSAKGYAKLAIYLGLEHLDVVKFEIDHPKNSERVLIEIINLWLNTATEPSWQSLEEAVQGLN